MDLFNTTKSCLRCGDSFSDFNLRIQSWFNDEVICSLSCHQQEEEFLRQPGIVKFEFEGCGYVPYKKNTIRPDRKKLEECSL